MACTKTCMSAQLSRVSPQIREKQHLPFDLPSPPSFPLASVCRGVRQPYSTGVFGAATLLEIRYPNYLSKVRKEDHCNRTLMVPVLSRMKPGRAEINRV